MNLSWPGRLKGPGSSGAEAPEHRRERWPAGARGPAPSQPGQAVGLSRPDAEAGGEGAWTWSWQNRRLRALLLVGLLGLLLMTLSSPGAQRMREGISPAALSGVPGSDSAAAGPGVWPGPQELARALEEALSRIQGAGRVHVLLTMETSAQQVYAGQTTREYRGGNGGAPGSPTWDSRESWQPVLVRGQGTRGEEGLVQLVKAPRLRGVVVVAEGAADPRVHRSLLRAVEAITGLGAHRVAILPGR